MSFRDDLVAAHLRVEQLEEDNRELRYDLAAATNARPHAAPSLAYSLKVMLASFAVLTALGLAIAELSLRAGQ